MSQRTGAEWGDAKNLGPSLNTDQNEGPDTFSVDKRTLYFTGCDRKDARASATFTTRR